MTNEFACATRDSITVDVYDNASVGEFKFGKLQVFPNPTNNKFSIYLEGLNGNVDFILSDAFGKRIQAQTLYTSNGVISESIEVSSL